MTRGMGGSPNRILGGGDAFAPPSLHRYVYAIDNPVRFSDPSGNTISDETANLIGYAFAWIGGTFDAIVASTWVSTITTPNAFKIFKGLAAAASRILFAAGIVLGVWQIYNDSSLTFRQKWIKAIIFITIATIGFLLSSEIAGSVIAFGFPPLAMGLWMIGLAVFETFVAWISMYYVDLLTGWIDELSDPWGEG